MSNRTYVLVLLALFPCLGQAAAQAPASGRTLRAQTEILFTLTLDAKSAPRLPASADAVAFDRSNRLYVLDRQNRFVYVFHADGRSERRLALGADMRAPLQMTVTRDDRIVVSDAVRNVFVSIDPSDPGRSAEHPVGEMALTGPLAAHPDGGVITQARPLSDADLVEGQIGPPRVMWFPLNGRPPVVLHEFPPVPAGRGPRGALSPPPLVAPMSPRGAVVAHPRAYRLQIVGGGRTREITRAITARATTERDRRWAARQSACSQLFMMGSSGPVPTGAAPSAPDAREAPARMPVLRAVGTRPGGDIWVERMAPDPGRAGPVDVFGPDGRFVGTIEGVGVPRSWAPDGRTAAYVEQDAQCGYTVQARRVTLSGGG